MKSDSSDQNAPVTSPPSRPPIRSATVVIKNPTRDLHAPAIETGAPAGGADESDGADKQEEESEPAKSVKERIAGSKSL